MRRSKIVLSILLTLMVLVSGAGVTGAVWSSVLAMGGETITAGQYGLKPLSVIWSRNGQPLDLAEDSLNTGDKILFEARVDYMLNAPNMTADLSISFKPVKNGLRDVKTEILDRRGEVKKDYKGGLSADGASIGFGRVGYDTMVEKLDGKTDLVARFSFTVGENPAEVGMRLAKARDC